MKYLFIIAYAFILFLTRDRNIDSAAGKIDRDAYVRALDKKRSAAIYCTPDWSTFHLSKADIEGMVPLPGTGTHTWKISTNNDSAQFYFNQGINLYYGFHIIEALPSFKKGYVANVWYLCSNKICSKTINPGICKRSWQRHHCKFNPPMLPPITIEQASYTLSGYCLSAC